MRKQWYGKSFYLITEKNFLEVLTWIFAASFFVIKQITGEYGTVTNFSLGLALGQTIERAIMRAKMKRSSS